jgi:hypothetical protein
VWCGPPRGFTGANPDPNPANQAASAASRGLGGGGTGGLLLLLLLVVRGRFGPWSGFGVFFSLSRGPGQAGAGHCEEARGSSAGMSLPW